MSSVLNLGWSALGTCNLSANNGIELGSPDVG